MLATEVGALVPRFRALYSGLSYSRGSYQLSDGQEDSCKKKGKGVSIRVNSADEWPTLWTKHLAGEASLGVVPINEDSTALFGAIDIDGKNGDYVGFDPTEYVELAAEI